VPTLHLSDAYGTPVFTLAHCAGVPLKDVYGATYHGPTQTWRFPAFRPVHRLVLEDLKVVVKGLVLSEEAKQHATAQDVLQELPADYKYVTQPYQHQAEGVKHLYNFLRAGLFFDAGLGKCKVTVDLQRLVQEPVLVVCPRVMLHTWREEFEKHGNITDVIVIDGVTKKKKLKQIAEAAERVPAATILTYGVATRYVPEIIAIPYKILVADESHQLKSPFAKRSVAVSTLAGRAYRRVLLSGTPSLGSPFDLYGQLRFLGKYFCPENWWDFRKVFGVFPAYEAAERVPKMLLGFQNLELMNKRVSLVCVKKTKEECLDLPDQQIIDVKFTVYASQKKAYNTLILDQSDAAGTAIKLALEEGTLNHSQGTVLPPHVYVPEVISQLNKLDQIASGFLYQTTRNPRLCDGCEHVRTCATSNVLPYTSKCSVVAKMPASVVKTLPHNARLEQLEGTLDTLLEEEANQIIVWARYRIELDQITDLLTKRKVSHVRVEGGMSSSNLEKAKNSFNADNTIRVYVGQVSTGIGLTLNAANYTIYYNLPWSLEHYLQSMDRNYRIGQDKKVTVYRLIARYTLDEAKAVALDQKMDFNTLVTSRSVCASCPEFSRRCAVKGIKLYANDCIYERTMMRSTASVRTIP